MDLDGPISLLSAETTIRKSLKAMDPKVNPALWHLTLCLLAMVESQQRLEEDQQRILNRVDAILKQVKPDYR